MQTATMCICQNFEGVTRCDTCDIHLCKYCLQVHHCGQEDRYLHHGVMVEVPGKFLRALLDYADRDQARDGRFGLTYYEERGMYPGCFRCDFCGKYSDWSKPGIVINHLPECQLLQIIPLIQGLDKTLSSIGYYDVESDYHQDKKNWLG